MTVKALDVRTLFNAGFTGEEIKALREARDPNGNLQPEINLRSPFYAHLVFERRKTFQKLYAEYELSHKVKLSRPLYNQIIDQWHKTHGHDVFAFIKLSYKPKLKVDFKKAAERKKKLANMKRGLHREFKR